MPNAQQPFAINVVTWLIEVWCFYQISVQLSTPKSPTTASCKPLAAMLDYHTTRQQ
jgi:hypothetical protein